MLIIDSQVHAYEANTPERPWHSVPNWPPHVTGDEMVAAMDKVGVDGAIFISAFSLYQYDASYAVDARSGAARLSGQRPLLGKPRGGRDADRSPSEHPLHHRPHGDPAAAHAARPARACTLSHKPYPFPDIWDPIRRLIDAWGVERCLWGTDWTRAFAVVNYEQAVEPFLKTDRLSERERAMLMGGACAKAYGWSPKKG